MESLARLDDEKAFQYLGSLIDSAFHLGRPEGTDKALAWSDELEVRPLSAANQMLLDYFRANAWENRKNLHIHDKEKAWRWTQPEALQQILFLRRAVRRAEFPQWESVRQAEVLTNLANQLNTLGRFVEALNYWTRALVVRQNFGMALGNRGLALSIYARALFDNGHKRIFLLFSHHDLSAALSESAYYESEQDAPAKNAFRQRKEEIEALITIPKGKEPPKLHEHSIGDTDEERRYRQWVLYEKLFLTPLNDLGYHSIAACDTFTLPSFVTAINEPPTWIGFFNQMKQEYVSARWMLYEGMQVSAPHFSDKNVTLYNTLDYPSYSLAVERTKSAFRTAYSLFDKIGFFLK
ncbi:MAG: LA2681 family HEPN domain-containing protein [Pseudolabrys sp.]